MVFNSNELLARFTLKGLDGCDSSELSEEELDALTNQVVAEFETFKRTCNNTSKETQMQSITDYFANK